MFRQRFVPHGWAFGRRHDWLPNRSKKKVSVQSLGFAVLMPSDPKPMKVVLISDDGDLHTLCGEILNGFTGDDWQLSPTTPSTYPADADFYIWDCTPSIEFPAELAQRLSKHLFLVHRNEITTFYKNLGTAEATILLKPVTRASLSAFLGLAAATAKERIATANSLRADRDEMLQCLIQSNLQLPGIRPGSNEFSRSCGARFSCAPDCDHRLLWASPQRSAGAVERRSKGSTAPDATQRKAPLPHGFSHVRSERRTSSEEATGSTRGEHWRMR